MFNKKWFVLVILALLVIVTGVVLAQDDGRINQAHHFGGDTLYCTLEDGCWMLNMHGELLWSVAQATIDAANATACETGVGQSIVAGEGTYGTSTLMVNCGDSVNKTMTLAAYDEWGKLNSMDFWPWYMPVGGGDPNLCQIRWYWIATGETAFYTVYNDSGDGFQYNDDPFVDWQEGNPELPYCHYLRSDN